MNESMPADADSHAAISVILITCNEQENIRDCLDSLSALDYPMEKHEILVVDASTDDTPQIVGQYPQIKLIRSDKGFSAQRNTGLECARYSILAFTDADCIIPQDWLQKIDRAFKNQRIAAIGGNAFPPPETGRWGTWMACIGHPAGGAVGFDANISRTDNGIDFVAGCNAAYRKDVLYEVGGFDPRFEDGGEDVNISWRMRHKGYCLEYIPELLVYHKPRPNLWEFMGWNVRVGVTKFNLFRPSFLKIVLQPSFPLWSALIPIAIVLSLQSPGFFLITLFALWLLSIAIPMLGSRPYGLLIKRRKRVGVSLPAILLVIPFLIYIRQLCINLGQLKKWACTRNESKRLSGVRRCS